MKVTIEIDCTPLEARLFMGLPDVQPMQAALLADMERRLMAEADKFSPEGLMHTWFSALPQGAELMRDMLGGIFAKAGGGRAGADRSDAAKTD